MSSIDPNNLSHQLFQWYFLAKMSRTKGNTTNKGINTSENSAFVGSEISLKTECVWKAVQSAVTKRAVNKLLAKYIFTLFFNQSCALLTFKMFWPTPLKTELMLNRHYNTNGSNSFRAFENRVGRKCNQKHSLKS